MIAGDGSMHQSKNVVSVRVGLSDAGSSTRVFCFDLGVAVRNAIATGKAEGLHQVIATASVGVPAGLASYCAAPYADATVVVKAVSGSSYGFYAAFN